MSWITDCPVCGHSVSVNADRCPNCGEPLRNGMAVGGRKLAPIGLIPLSVFQMLLFWLYPLFATVGILFGSTTSFQSQMGFYFVYTVIAIILLITGIRTSNKRYYRAWGASVVTTIFSAFNTLGGGYMVLAYLSNLRK